MIFSLLELYSGCIIVIVITATAVAITALYEV